MQHLLKSLTYFFLKADVFSFAGKNYPKQMWKGFRTCFSKLGNGCLHSNKLVQKQQDGC